MHASIHVTINMYVHNMCIYVYTCQYIYTHLPIYTDLYMLMYIHLYVCIDVHNMCMYVYTYIHICWHTLLLCMYIPIHKKMHIFYSFIMWLSHLFSNICLYRAQAYIEVMLYIELYIDNCSTHLPLYKYPDNLVMSTNVIAL